MTFYLVSMILPKSSHLRYSKLVTEMEDYFINYNNNCMYNFKMTITKQKYNLISNRQLAY